MNGAQTATQDVDYIIVGAGTAGCVLANRLSEDPNTSVLLLEAGGKDNYPWIKIPIGYLYTMNNPRTDWCFKTQPDKGLNGRSLNYPRGKTLGGCSSINGMIYMRGQAADYDHWRDLGNPGWSWQEILPYFKKSEDHFKGASQFHGSGGEWRVEQQRLSWPILDSVMQGAAQCGITQSDDYNDGNNEGFCYFEVNQKKGRRWSTADGFLRPALGRDNLTLLTQANVDTLLLEQKEVQGVEVIVKGQKQRFHARREVILTAGAIASPLLLQRSGIGDPNVLSAHGIDTQHELPGVGENLQDHLQIRTVFKIENGKTLNEQANSVWGKLKMGLQYAFNRSGPLSMAPSQMGGFAKSSEAYSSANIEY
ncbi:MAG: GMC family oxidoreductase, partial [Pseudomonadales bacterium]